MTLTWTTDLPDVLWHIEAPMPAYIATTVDGMFALTIPALAANKTSTTAASLEAAEALYVSLVEQALSQMVQINTQLLGVHDPLDGQYIAVVTPDGVVSIGNWSQSAMACTVAAATIPAAEIIVWSAVPAAIIP